MVEGYVLCGFSFTVCLVNEAMKKAGSVIGLIPLHCMMTNNVFLYYQ